MSNDPFEEAFTDPAFFAKMKRENALRNMTSEERREFRIREFEEQKAAAAAAQAPKAEERKPMTEDELTALFQRANEKTLDKLESALWRARNENFDVDALEDDDGFGYDSGEAY